MQKAEAHVYFSDTIGMGDWFYGTTINDVRYCVEGWAAYDGGSLPDNELPKKVILHFPCCYGGDVFTGYGIYNYLRELAAKGVQIEAQVKGLCASIATLIALAADTVFMAEAAFWMVHKPSVDAGPGANADEHQKAAVLLDKIQAQIAGRYVARSGGKLDLPTANNLMNQETWLTADECLSYGFVTAKLEEAPLEVPQGAEKVLNYYRPTNKAPMPKLTETEEQGLFEKFKNWLKPKNEAESTPPPAETTVTNTSVAVTDGEPMYCDGEIAQGTAVYSDEAMTVAYADGTYALSDGRSATVAAGVLESLADAAAEDNAGAAPATNSAELEAANAKITELEATNALQLRTINGLKNKVAKQVPGSTGNPTKPGEAQNIIRKPGAAATNNAESPISFSRPTK